MLGDRRQARCWTRLWCAPGNPGIAPVAENVAIGAVTSPPWSASPRVKQIDLVVVGPEAPLAAGLADACAAAGHRVLGPTAAAARLEGSKASPRRSADAAGIPTAAWERFDDAAAARASVRGRGAPIVVKADGLAAGKGVVVAATVEEAEAAIDDIMERRPSARPAPRS